MFNIKELKLTFIDPIDLLVDTINKFLESKKIVKIIFF